MTQENKIDNKVLVRGFEGGAIYKGDLDGVPVLQINEAAMFDMLSEEDREGMEPARIIRFDDSAARAAYLRERYRISDLD